MKLFQLNEIAEETRRAFDKYETRQERLKAWDRWQAAWEEAKRDGIQPDTEPPSIRGLHHHVRKLALQEILKFRDKYEECLRQPTRECLKTFHRRLEEDASCDQFYHPTGE